MLSKEGLSPFIYLPYTTVLHWAHLVYIIEAYSGQTSVKTTLLRCFIYANNVNLCTRAEVKIRKNRANFSIFTYLI